MFVPTQMDKWDEMKSKNSSCNINETLEFAWFNLRCPFYMPDLHTAQSFMWTMWSLLSLSEQRYLKNMHLSLRGLKYCIIS